MGILRTDKISGLETPTAVTGSVSFDGNDNLSIGSAGDFNFLHNARSDWTAEFWVKTGSATRQFVFGNGASSAQVGFSITVMSTDDNQDDGTGVFAMFGRGSSGNYRYWGSNGGLTVDTWHHVAAVFKSSDKTLVLYVDGIEVDSGTGTANGTFSTTDYSTSNSTYAFLVAKNEHSDTYLTGEISNLRVVDGRRLYTSDFTPPVHALETIDGTRILCCNNPDSVTAVSNAGVEAAPIATASGDPTVATDNPSLTRDFTYGTEFKGVTTFDTQGYFVPPSGTTEQRGRGRGIFWGGNNGSNQNIIQFVQISTQGNASDFGDLTTATSTGGSCASATRGLYGGGQNPGTTDTIEFITIATLGNAIDFGNLQVQRDFPKALSNSTRGIFAGGRHPAPATYRDEIDFVTIATLGNASDFGDLLAARQGPSQGVSSPTRGLFAGGTTSPGTHDDVIQYITIATTGDAQDFGDLTQTTHSVIGGASSSTRGLFAGGSDPSAVTNVISYVTIATLGNAQDFGDLTDARRGLAGASNSSRGAFGGGLGSPTDVNTIDYVTIATTGNANDFGDLTHTNTRNIEGCSDSHGGIS